MWHYICAEYSVNLLFQFPQKVRRRTSPIPRTKVTSKAVAQCHRVISDIQNMTETCHQSTNSFVESDVTQSEFSVLNINQIFKTRSLWKKFSWHWRVKVKVNYIFLNYYTCLVTALNLITDHGQKAKRFLPQIFDSVIMTVVITLDCNNCPLVCGVGRLPYSSLTEC